MLKRNSLFVMLKSRRNTCFFYKKNFKLKIYRTIISFFEKKNHLLYLQTLFILILYQYMRKK